MHLSFSFIEKKLTKITVCLMYMFKLYSTMVRFTSIMKWSPWWVQLTSFLSYIEKKEGNRKKICCLWWNLFSYQLSHLSHSCVSYSHSSYCALYLQYLEPSNWKFYPLTVLFQFPFPLPFNSGKHKSDFFFYDFLVLLLDSISETFSVWFIFLTI